MIRWPWSHDRIRASEHVYPCPTPDCLSTRPAFLVAQLGNVVRRDGRAHAIPTGGKLSCQECGMVYCVDERGTFKPHPNALPLVPQTPRGHAEVFNRGAPPSEGGEMVERPLPPRPRERPPV